MKKCENGCAYSRSMFQVYPRTCIRCGRVEETVNTQKTPTLVQTRRKALQNREK